MPGRTYDIMDNSSCGQRVETKLSQPSLMDKSLGTNLHLRHFFTHAEQSRANSSTLIQPLPPTPHPYNVAHVYTATRYFSRVSTL